MKNRVLAFLKDRILLFIVLLLFVAVKVMLIDSLYYWDESWSYEPGVRLMYEHGPSLMPNAIDVGYSRGHPLLFYALAAGWMRIFGPSNIAQHAFSLFVSVLVIISVYEISLRVFNKRVATIALLLVPLQVVFFVQSTMMLPEIMVGLFCLWTLWFYSAERYVLAFLSCTALMLTKESGMVLGLVLGVHACIRLLDTSYPMAARLKNFCAPFFAGVVIGLYFIAQKKLNGWYFFPEHVGYIKWIFGVFWDNLLYCLHMLFVRQYRLYLFIFFMVLSAATAIKNKDWRFLVPLATGLFLYTAIDIQFKWMPRMVVFALMSVAIIYDGYLLIKTLPASTMLSRRFTGLAWSFFICYMLFSSINFLTIRYTICVLFVLLVVVAAYLDVFVELLHKDLYLPVIGVLLLIGYFGYRNNTGLSDVDLGSYSAMKVEEDLVRYLERNNLYDQPIAAWSFQNREHLEKPMTGFLHTQRKFTDIRFMTPTSKYVVFDNIEPDNRYERVRDDTTNFRLIFRAAQGQAWGEVYVRKLAKP